MIIEGLVTTRSADGTVNVAPMGPHLAPLPDGSPDWTRLTLKPFATSRTFGNLEAIPRGVFHLTDDAFLLAKAAIGEVSPQLVASESIDVPRLADCVRWLEFEVLTAAGERPRETLGVRVVHDQQSRPWHGFNRAKHAVLEAAVLATRVHMVGPEETLRQMEPYRIWVDKTAGPAEREAWETLEAYVRATSFES